MFGRRRPQSVVYGWGQGPFHVVGFRPSRALSVGVCGVCLCVVWVLYVVSLVVACLRGMWVVDLSFFFFLSSFFSSIYEMIRNSPACLGKNDVLKDFLIHG
jgi:hypothetical protein